MLAAQRAGPALSQKKRALWFWRHLFLEGRYLTSEDIAPVYEFHLSPVLFPTDERRPNRGQIRCRARRTLDTAAGVDITSELQKSELARFPRWLAGCWHQGKDTNATLCCRLRKAIISELLNEAGK